MTPGAPGTRQSIRGSGVRGLLYILEDDASTRDLLVELSTDAGWDARPFPSVTALRHGLADRLPDLLIADDEVDAGSAGELPRQLHAEGQLRGTPIILLTAAGPARRAELASWARIIPKPFDVSEIERTLTGPVGTHHNGGSEQAAG
jgi:DNA-binding response OmpR family regulator